MNTKERHTFIPLLEWLPFYRKAWFSSDLIAGLTTSAVVIPKAMAYAAIAGLPLVVGLYSSIIPLVMYAILGTSRVLSVTTTSTIAILTAGAISQSVPGNDPAAQMAVAATLAFLVGACLLAGGFLHLGAVASLISEPVLTGFKAGIGLVVILDQIPKLLGIHITKVDFIRDILSIGSHLTDTSVPTLLLALSMLLFMVGLEQFTPRLPAPLLTVAVGIAAVYFAGLERMGIQLVGTVAAGLPSFAPPDLSLVAHLWPDALGIALISFVETAAAGRAFVQKGELRPEANQELVALGAANLVGSLFHAMPAGGGTSQTAVNVGAGARSQISGVVTATVVVATLLILAPLFSLMPQATMAAVVIVASIGLISPAEFAAIRNIRAMEFHWALMAMAGVAILGTLQGILVAVVMSLLVLILRANRRPVAVMGRKPGTAVFRPLSPEHPNDETFPGLLIVKPEGSIYFGNASWIGDQIQARIREHQPGVVVFDCSANPDIEYTALKMLGEAEEMLRSEGIILCLAALNPEPLRIIQRMPLGKILGRERMFFTLEQAVNEYGKFVKMNTAG